MPLRPSASLAFSPSGSLARLSTARTTSSGGGSCLESHWRCRMRFEGPAVAQAVAQVGGRPGRWAAPWAARPPARSPARCTAGGRPPAPSTAPAPLGLARHLTRRLPDGALRALGRPSLPPAPSMTALVARPECRHHTSQRKWQSVPPYDAGSSSVIRNGGLAAPWLTMAYSSGMPLLVGLALLAFWLYCLFDVITTPDEEVQKPSQTPLGDHRRAAAPRSAACSGCCSAAPEDPRRLAARPATGTPAPEAPKGPDDDPDFLKDLDRRLRDED